VGYDEKDGLCVTTRYNYDQLALDESEESDSLDHTDMEPGKFSKPYKLALYE
jgi:hypothetical protein